MNQLSILVFLLGFGFQEICLSVDAFYTSYMSWSLWTWTMQLAGIRITVKQGKRCFVKGDRINSTYQWAASWLGQGGRVKVRKAVMNHRLHESWCLFIVSFMYNQTASSFKGKDVVNVTFLLGNCRGEMTHGLGLEWKSLLNSLTLTLISCPAFFAQD